MTNIEVFECASKAQRFARIYAQQHRISTRVIHQETDWIVQANERKHGPTQLEPQPAKLAAQPTPSAPAVDPQTLPGDEQQRLSRFQIVDDLLHLTDPKERERCLDTLCSRWGGRHYLARKLLRELTNEGPDRKALSGRLRRRLR